MSHRIVSRIINEVEHVLTINQNLHWSFERYSERSIYDKMYIYKQKYARKQPNASKKKRRKALQIVLSTNKGYIQERLKRFKQKQSSNINNYFREEKTKRLLVKKHFLSKIARGHSIAAIVLTIQGRRKSSKCPFRNCCSKHVYHWTTIDEIVINWFFLCKQNKDMFIKLQIFQCSRIFLSR